MVSPETPSVTPQEDSEMRFDYPSCWAVPLVLSSQWANFPRPERLLLCYFPFLFYYPSPSVQLSSKSAKSPGSEGNAC